MKEKYANVENLKDHVKKSMDKHFVEHNRTWFSYNGDIDVVGHNFSARRIEAQYCYAEQ